MSLLLCIYGMSIFNSPSPIQHRRTHLPSRVRPLHARIDTRIALHRLHHRSTLSRAQHALQVSTTLHNIRHRRLKSKAAPPRRTLARKHLKPNEIPLTFTSFPRLGVPGVFTEPYFDPKDAVSSHSLFLPEEITNPHVRFPLRIFYLFFWVYRIDVELY